MRFFQLEYLDLGRNQISVLDPLAFDGLDQLTVLKLDDNRFTTVPSNAFTIIPHLLELHLGQNGIQSLEADVFRDLSRLSILDLTGANIYNVSNLGFRGLRRLQVLRLGKNALDTLPVAALDHLRQLEELNLSHNFIEIIPSNALPGLVLLTSFNVSYSPNLIRIGSNAFQDNRALKWIILSGSKRVKEIEPDALTVVPFDEEIKLGLVLQDMDLEVVNRNMADWAYVRYLDLAQNPLTCDCRMKWLHQLTTESMLNFNTTSLTVQAVCSSPEQLARKNLSEISIGALSCNSMLVTRSPDDQLLLVSICVGAALCTGLLVFAAVHCSRQKVECRTSNCFDDVFESRTSPSSASASSTSTSWRSRRSFKRFLCCCRRVNFSLLAPFA